MTDLLLAVDAGGTSTRAVVLTADGTCRGSGTAGSGNPTASGAVTALASIAAASNAALAAAGAGPSDLEGVVTAMAGAERPLPVADLARALGFEGPLDRLRKVGDLLAMYFSGTPAPDGVALIAGTGSVAGRIVDGELARVAGGSGWLLGDAGSGFWIGVRVVRAVVADLDGSGPHTVLTDAVLTDLALVRDQEWREGRPEVLYRLIDVLYDLQPVQLARFAPLAFALAPTDPVAAVLVERAGDALAGLVSAVHPGQGPLVAGGSVWRKGILGPGGRTSPALADLLTRTELLDADDGLLGAAVLALRGSVEVDEALHTRVKASLALVRPGSG